VRTQTKKQIAAKLAVVVMMGVVGAPQLALAGPKDDDLKVRREEAAKIHAEGAALYTKGDYEGARAKFREAYARSQNPNSLLNEARATLKGYHYLDGAKLLKAYLALPENDKVTAADRKEAEGLLDEASVKLCTLDVRVSSCTVDGAPGQGMVMVEVGEHLVRMQGPKGEKLKAVQCGAKQTVLVTYDDEPVKGPGPGPGPLPPPKDEGEKGSWLVPGILAGVGVVGLGVGAGFHFAGVGTRDDATALQRPGACTDRGSAECTAISDKLDAASTQRTVSAVALIGGSAALGAAVVSLFVVRPWERRSRASVQGLVLPTFAPGYAGASFTRSF
jgi:hypothetical protein